MAFLVFSGFVSGVLMRGYSLVVSFLKDGGRNELISSSENSSSFFIFNAVPTPPNVLLMMSHII